MFKCIKNFVLRTSTLVVAVRSQAACFAVSYQPVADRSLRIDVPTGSRSYRIHVGRGLVRRLSRIIKDSGGSGRQFVVSSPTVWKHHGDAIRAALKTAEIIVIPDEERSKTLSTAARIYEPLIAAGADRSSIIIAIGGGVIGDVVGFAAATFLRGVSLAHVPTTLLAQVDSSIGGKVGVNHSLGKNLIGAFHQPIVVVADPELLSTLPRREFRAGLYEVVKYGVIASRDLFDRVTRDLIPIFARDPKILIPIIAAAAQLKADIVAKDEREQDLRRVLNFGHTIGHAIEAVTNYRRFRHGEAVAFGMLAIGQLAVERDAFRKADQNALENLIAQLGPLPSVSDLTISAIVQAVRRDKKVYRGRLHVVLPTSIGQTTIVSDVTERELARALRAIGIRRK